MLASGKRDLFVSCDKGYRDRCWGLEWQLNNAIVDPDSYYLWVVPPSVCRHTQCFILVTHSYTMIAAPWSCPPALEKGKEVGRERGKREMIVKSISFSQERKNFLKNLTQLCLLFTGQNGVKYPPAARRWLSRRELCMTGQLSPLLTIGSAAPASDEKRWATKMKTKNIKSSRNKKDKGNYLLPPSTSLMN